VLGRGPRGGRSCCRASHAIDRATEDVWDAVRAHTGGVGWPLYSTHRRSNLRDQPGTARAAGLLINYGELSGPVPAINLHQLFTASVFVTKYNGMH
jgi:NADPH2:quinone reductase